MITISIKKLIVVAVLGIAALTISAFTKNENEAKYITMRIQEPPNGLYPAKLVVAYGGKIEEKDLQTGGKGFIPNSIIINEAINSLHAKGYELLSQSGGDMNSTYNFIKR